MSHKPLVKKFTAIIKDAEKGAAYVEIPFDIYQVFGKKRLKVKANIEGELYRGSVVKMGTPCYILLIRKDIRTKLGKNVGDQICISIQEDTEPRIVLIPDDLKQIFEKQPVVQKRFEKLPYTHQKEYVDAITEAKQEVTRKKRIAKLLENLMNTSSK